MRSVCSLELHSLDAMHPCIRNFDCNNADTVRRRQAARSMSPLISGQADRCSSERSERICGGTCTKEDVDSLPQERFSGENRRKTGSFVDMIYSFRSLFRFLLSGPSVPCIHKKRFYIVFVYNIDTILHQQRLDVHGEQTMILFFVVADQYINIFGGYRMWE